MNKLFINYLKTKRWMHFDLKAVIFDMDGVLYDSMPAHDLSWREAMDEFGLKYLPNEFFLQEGRLGHATINAIFQRNLNRESTSEEEEKIYARKSELFRQYNNDETMPGARETLEYVQQEGLIPILVTGSGQPTLLDRLATHFPGAFTPDTMVTAFNVKQGKPHPEPFLKGLEMGGNLQPNQAIVIENAPLGIEAAVKAGIFTIAVNTGPLDDSVLKDAGASIVFHSMPELTAAMPEILHLTRTIRV
ncbi:MAG: HAD-IA family hydrolase [Bacteroidota bacterium]|jgi:HAD superfamily hydrolase (TIGR01509 family)|nr:HAD-IA family hydrolase [Bacteroidota bacterium]HHU97258.1 HAD-IA family hydrolase [Petrimonas sp.]